MVVTIKTEIQAYMQETGGGEKEHFFSYFIKGTENI